MRVKSHPVRATTAVLLAVFPLTALAAKPASLEELVFESRNLCVQLRSGIDYGLAGPEGAIALVDSQLLDASAERLGKRFEQALAAHARERPKADAKRRATLAEGAEPRLAALREYLAQRTRSGFLRARTLTRTIETDFDELLKLK